MYNKLFSKIVNSSVWMAPTDHRIIWITLLALMDQDGFVAVASIQNLAHTARIPLKAAQAAVTAFESPDVLAPTQEFEGRRIERVPGGWMVLHAPKYRAMATAETIREQTRLRTQAYRQRKVTASDASVTHRDEIVTPSETETNSKQIQKNTTAASRPDEPLEFIEFKSIYPKRTGGQPWSRALKAIQARLRQGATWEQIMDGARRYASFMHATGKDHTEFVMQAATFCGPDKRYEERWEPPLGKAETRLAGNLDAALQARRDLFGGGQ
jgi:hypothetical protein